jgi:transcriptional regulator with XRE-family HTH domain
MSISPDQVKTARGLLGWPVSILAGKSGLSTTTISNFEKGARRPSVLNVSTIRKVFESAGVEFVGEAGARLRKAAEDGAEIPHHETPAKRRGNYSRPRTPRSE